MRVRRSTEMSTSGGSSETDMNAFAVIPCTWSRLARRDHGHARGEHAERAAQRDPRVVAHLGRRARARAAPARRRSGCRRARPGPAQTAVPLSGRSNSEGGLGARPWIGPIVTRRGRRAGRPVRELVPRWRDPRSRSARGGGTVRISSADKLLFPADGITKADLARYYAGDRAGDGAARQGPAAQPVALERGDREAGGDPAGDPEGRAGVGAHASPSTRRKGGEVTPRRRRRARDAGLARQPELHHAPRVAEPRRPPRLPRPDRLRPRPARRGRRRRTSPTIRAGALLLGERLRELGLTPFAMTSGSRGLHVVAPLRRRHHADVVRARAGEIADDLRARRARRRPDDVLAQGEARRARALLDTARNTYGQTTVAPYAVRAHPRRAGGDAARLGGARGPGAAPARCTRCARSRAARGARRPVGADRARPRRELPTAAGRAELAGARVAGADGSASRRGRATPASSSVPTRRARAPRCRVRGAEPVSTGDRGAQSAGGRPRAPGSSAG